MTSEMLSAEKYLRIINDRGKRQLPLKRVCRNMRQQGLFLQAYANLYANRGATTKGTDPEDTIQGMSLKRIDTIIAKLRNGNYQWKPARRKYVPKSNGQKRPISIPNWSDKLVQEVIRLILEAYYEPQFRESSHGFRPNRGCHTALQAIKRPWKGTRWFIEGDIKGCFDNLRHDTVVEILSHSIQDNRFLKLVKGMLRAGYMEDWVYHKTMSGAPQGGIISPLLSNIVLNELDRFVEDILIPKYTKGKKRKASPEYDSLMYQKMKARKRRDYDAVKAIEKQKRQIPICEPNDPNYRRLRYIRYADDFLLGFIGSKAEAQEIKEELGDYLATLGLTMSKEKTYITHARSKRVRFLGYEISVSWDNNRLSTFRSNGKVIRSRQINGAIHFHVPKDVATKWASRYSRKGKPHHLGQYVNLSDYEIVETYGAQLRGVAQYYKLAVDIGKRLSKVYWFGKESCRKTLCNKNKLTTRQSYIKYMKDGSHKDELRHIEVAIERDGKPSLAAKCGEFPLRYDRDAVIKDKIPPYVIAGGHSELTRRLLANVCELCDAKGSVQGHHVRSVKDIRRRWQKKKEIPEWVAFIMERRRKTVFVCETCHQKITQGRYDGKRIR